MNCVELKRVEDGRGMRRGEVEDVDKEEDGEPDA